MRLIKHSEISAKILTLLDESDERVIIVSPYLKIAKWYKLTNRINALRTKGVIIEIYVREAPDNIASYRDLEDLDLQYNKVPNLHCKFYMNEKYGIITSMNLLLSSEFNSLEIGYITETRNEYNQLFEYYHRNIQSAESIYPDTYSCRQDECMKEFTHSIKAELDAISKNSWSWHKDHVLHICTGKDNFSVSIFAGSLKIIASLRIPPGTRQQFLMQSSFITKKVKDLTVMSIDVYAGHAPDILLITGEAHLNLHSRGIANIMETEARTILDFIRRFVEATDDHCLLVGSNGTD